MRDEVNTAFQFLSWLPSEDIFTRSFIALKSFVSYAYVKTDAPLNEARLFVYTSSEKDEMRALPPTDDGLLYHVRRSCYQAG